MWQPRRWRGLCSHVSFSFILSFIRPFSLERSAPVWFSLSLSHTHSRRPCAHTLFYPQHPIHPSIIHSFILKKTPLNPKLRHAPLDRRQLLLLLGQRLLRRGHQLGRGLGQEGRPGQALLQALFIWFLGVCVVRIEMWEVGVYSDYTYTHIYIYMYTRTTTHPMHYIYVCVCVA